MKTQLPNVRAVAASVEGNVRLPETAGVPVRVVRVTGVAESWPDMRGVKLRAGRLISQKEHGRPRPSRC